MIARIKKTGKLIDVVPYGDEFAQLFPGGDFKVYAEDELDFNVDVDWQQTRIQFIGQIASAIMSNYEFYAHAIGEECKKSRKSRPEMVAQMSLEIADALIAELQKKGGEK